MICDPCIAHPVAPDDLNRDLGLEKPEFERRKTPNETLKMPVLPVPLIVALALTGLLLHRVLTRSRPLMLLAIIGLCALQSATIAAVQYYGIAPLRVAQPVLAATIPACAWLAFQQSAKGALHWQSAGLHLSAPPVALAGYVFAPAALDVFIPALFLGYGVGILLGLRQGEDGLSHSRLDSSTKALLVWRVVAVALLTSAASDIVISIELARGDTGALLWLPSILSSAIMLVLGGLALTHAIESKSGPADALIDYSPHAQAHDDTIMEQLSAYMQTHETYRDPDLTLSQLARKLRIPEKQLSRAVNKRTHENVSRYINAFRVDYACRLIGEGTSVTEAMFASGFNTKSKFNREFLRLKHVNPTKWALTQNSAPPDNRS